MSDTPIYDMLDLGRRTDDDALLVKMFMNLGLIAPARPEHQFSQGGLVGPGPRVDLCSAFLAHPASAAQRERNMRILRETQDRLDAPTT